MTNFMLLISNLLVYLYKDEKYKLFFLLIRNLQQQEDRNAFKFINNLFLLILNSLLKELPLFSHQIEGFLFLFHAIA